MARNGQWSNAHQELELILELSAGSIDLVQRDYNNTIAMIFGTMIIFAAINKSVLTIELLINLDPHG